MDQILFYARNLAVPARRNVDDPTVLRGKRLFYRSGCIACHVPKLATRRDEGRSRARGPADLALHRPPAARHGRGPRRSSARGRGRWPGVAHAAAVGHRPHRDGQRAIPYFLHDGRARNLTEAILWHGGEAQAARDAFAALSKADRDALLAFLNSL